MTGIVAGMHVKRFDFYPGFYRAVRAASNATGGQLKLSFGKRVSKGSVKRERRVPKKELEAL